MSSEESVAEVVSKGVVENVEKVETPHLSADERANKKIADHENKIRIAEEDKRAMDVFYNKRASLIAFIDYTDVGTMEKGLRDIAISVRESDSSVENKYSQMRKLVVFDKFTKFQNVMKQAGEHKFNPELVNEVNRMVRSEWRGISEADIEQSDMISKAVQGDIDRVGKINTSKALPDDLYIDVSSMPIGAKILYYQKKQTKKQIDYLNSFRSRPLGVE